MALQFGDYEDVVFDHAPLVSVLCQIKFSPILSLMTAAGAAGFQAMLGDLYPSFEVSSEAGAAMLGPSVMAGPAPVWRMKDETSDWTVGLAADFISLETPTYTNITEFLDRLGAAVTALYRTLRPSDTVRIGLRKVNAFTFDPKGNLEELREILRPEVLGLIGGVPYPASVSGYYNQLDLRDDENRLTARCGIQRTDDDSDRLQFMLDFDYYTERPYGLDDYGPLRGLLKYFSDGITSFFHWAVVDSYKPKLGPRPRNEGAG